MKFTISLTHRCNLNCRYCYAGTSTRPDISLETALKCVDFGFDRALPTKSISFALFGGEPLLRFDLIEQVTEYIEQRALETGIDAEVSLTTNGTLIDETFLDFALKHNLKPCFSLDGPRDVHDRKRRFQDGGGSFDTVMANLALAQERLPKVQVNAVYGPDTIAEMPRTLEFFIESGIRIIHFNPDISAEWPTSLLPELPAIFRRMANLYIDAYRQGNEIAVNIFDTKMLLFIKGGYHPEDRCAMGEREWGFAPSGNIYPCERFIGDDEHSPYQIGNVHTGIAVQRHCSMLSARGNSQPECADCELKDYCMNWCGCTNHFMSGRADMPAAALCALEQSMIQSARHAFKTLTESENSLFTDHLFHYVHKDTQCV